MIIKPERRKQCPTCKREVRWIPAVEGCDSCGKQFDLNNRKLEATVFRKDDATTADHRSFCCWKCAIKFIKKVKSDYFVSLPYILFENDVPKGQRFEDFLQLLK